MKIITLVQQAKARRQKLNYKILFQNHKILDSYNTKSQFCLYDSSVGDDLKFLIFFSSESNFANLSKKYTLTQFRYNSIVKYFVANNFIVVGDLPIIFTFSKFLHLCHLFCILQIDLSVDLPLKLVSSINLSQFQPICSCSLWLICQQWSLLHLMYHPN